MRVFSASALTLLFLAFFHPVFGQSSESTPQSGPANAPSEQAPAQSGRERLSATANLERLAGNRPG